METEIPIDAEARFQRQLDICPPDKLGFPITVIGAGAIGSATILNLTKLGCTNITVWDNDTLEEHNIPNQICKPSMIGQSKTDAIKQLILELTGCEITGYPYRYNGQILDGVVVAAVDSMDVRQTIWQGVRLNTNVPLFVDPRMGAEVGRLYCIDPCEDSHIEFYESNLYSSEEAEDLPCSARSIIYCPSILSGFVTSSIKTFALGEKKPPLEIVIDIPSHVVSIVEGDDL